MRYNIYNNLRYNEDYAICYGPTSKEIDKVILHKNTRIIEKSAFSGCKKFKEIYLPPYLEEIGFCAFENTNLEHLVTPPLLSKIGKEAFMCCKNLFDVNLNWSQKLTFLSEATFESCSNLKFINFPEYLKEIKDKCFAYCNFEEINFPESVEILRNYAFYHCNELKTANLKNIKEIDDYCFSTCSKLENVTLSEKLKVLANGAFSNCTNLKYLDMPKNLPLSSFPFSHWDSLILYIDKNRKKEYEIFFENYREISLKEKDLDYYIDKGKSFKEINNILKGVER